ncbi:pyridoxamine 5'-phosphate oxidase family protein [Nonomuraea ferruginea]|uniref:Pyridoxamine 5'-phosphate oxidase family protein n=1 Tax=Nonomuraea ferruginea TaxID=46174 RepID=A0ABT4SXL5_9ACTN|nr:pyridoxamine 5'-phosphate oxidase family protein [Nonomuraea ferruginea]MDA0641997.1 pyridoxamine 5'-phosphate oxidase family protein [Nonomuraea ferruginea]
MLHQGEHTVQRRAGLTRDRWGSARVGATVPPVAADFAGRQRLVVIAAADDAGAAWTGVITGPPGFVAAPDDRTLVVGRLPAAGDPLAGLFDAERDIGILMIEPGSRKRMRVNGRAGRDGDRLLVRTAQVYSNCPKYIQTRTYANETVRGDAVAGGELTAGQQRWIAGADTFFIGTYAPGQGADASHRGGNPGFVTVTGDRRLTWPDYTGNAMYMTLGNLELEPRCGLLFLDWENGDTLHLTGRARVDWDPDRAATVPGAKRLVDFSVERVVQISGGMGQRWAFGEYSRFNPEGSKEASSATAH